MSSFTELLRKGGRQKAIVLLILIVYVSIASYLNGFHAFWSPDTGARFAMIRSLTESGRLIYPHYLAADLDPTGRIHPLTFFLFHRKHDFCMMYSPLFPFLSSIVYHAFGFNGLTLLPMLCGIATVIIFGRTARILQLRSRLLGMLALGLATPLIVYSVVFWDHSAQMMIAALSGYWMLQTVKQNHLRSAILIGVALGFGMWIHELFLALFAAVLLSALTIRRNRRDVSYGLLLGFVPMILIWGMFNLIVYSAFGGPHLGANVLQNNSDHPFSLNRIFDGPELADRSMLQLAGAAVFSSQDGLFPYHLAFVCLLIIYVCVGWAGKPVSVILPFLGLATAVFALVFLLQGAGAVDGLFLATPLLIPALSVPWHTAQEQPIPSTTRTFYSWLSRTCWLFILFMLVNPMIPGVDWGSRYLLAILPLLSLLTAYALEQQYQQTSGYGRRAVVGCAVSTIGVSLICQINGLLLVSRCLAYGRELNSRIQAISTQVLVTDTDLNALLTDLPLTQPRFEVRTDPDVKMFAMILRKRQYQEVTFVGTELGNVNVEIALAASGQGFMIREQHLLWNVNHASQEGKSLQLIRFVVKHKG